MVKKVSTIGDNTHSGLNVDIIKNLGDAKLYSCVANEAKVIGETYSESCKFKDINCMGEASFIKTEINNAKIIGETVLNNCSFTTARVIGNLDIKEVSKIDSLTILGNIQAENLECNNLSYGVKSENFIGIFKPNKVISSENFKLQGSCFGKTLESTLSIDIDAKLKYNNMIFLKPMKAANELECDAFYSLDRIELQGINSEYIFIKPSQNSRVNNLTGTKVMICRDFSITDKFKSIPKNYSDSVYENYDKNTGIIEIDTIEADEIYVEDANINCIRGQNIVVGKNCNIKKIEYTNSLEVSKNSIVNDSVKGDM